VFPRARVAVILVDELTVKDATATSFTVTVVTPIKLDPVIVIGEPAQTALGLRTSQELEVGH
jgi:hypothetical protein